MSLINNQGLSKSEKDIENDRLIKEYLDKGGKVTECQPNATTPNTGNMYGWGKRKPQEKSKEEPKEE
jgi:hypothetical protein